MEENMLVNDLGKKEESLFVITVRSHTMTQHQRSHYNEYNYSVFKTYPAGNKLLILLIFMFSVSPFKQKYLKIDKATNSSFQSLYEGFDIGLLGRNTVWTCR
jgi:hypothetical protein